MKSKKIKNSINYLPLVNNFVTDPDTFKAAGVAFTNGTHVLAGYQPYKKHPCISGIGGKRKKGENYMQTALRECIEELFEPDKPIPNPLFSKLVSVVPQKIIQSGSYINVIYSFDDLHKMLRIIKRSRLISRLYSTLPKNLNELIINRRLSSERKSEISHLTLLPIITTSIEEPFIDPYFLKDMPSFL